MDTKDADKKLCPSAALDEDAYLLGLVGADHRVRYVENPIRIGAEFVSNAERGNDAETRFRFAAPCVKCDCAQWKNNQCNVAKIAVEAMRVPTEKEAAPKCGIRSQCRWYAQESVKACYVCSKVVTHMPREIAESETEAMAPVVKRLSEEQV